MIIEDPGRPVITNFFLVSEIIGAYLKSSKIIEKQPVILDVF